MAKLLLRFALGLLCMALGLLSRVVGHFADGLVNLALHFFGDAGNLIFVHDIHSF